MKKANIPQDISIILFPIVMILVLGVLIYTVYNLGYKKIIEQRAAIAEEKRVENILAEKDTELKNMQSLVQQYSVSSVLALPPDPPVVEVISQIRRLAINNILSVTGINVKTTPAETEDSSVTIEVEFEGTATDTFNFFESIRRAAPLMVLKEAEFNNQDQSGNAEITFNSIYAKLPEQLPEINVAINKINQEEIEMLERMYNLEVPDFTDLEPTGESNRQNPFTF